MKHSLFNKIIDQEGTAAVDHLSHGVVDGLLKPVENVLELLCLLLQLVPEPQVLPSFLAQLF